MNDTHKAQARNSWENKAPKQLGNYDRSADRKAWIFYPCDDYAIRVHKETNDFWYAQLTTVQARDVSLKHAGPCKTRAEAINHILVGIMYHKGAL